MQWTLVTSLGSSKDSQVIFYNSTIASPSKYFYSTIYKCNPPLWSQQALFYSLTPRATTVNRILRRQNCGRNFKPSNRERFKGRVTWVQWRWWWWQGVSVRFVAMGVRVDERLWVSEEEEDKWYDMTSKSSTVTIKAMQQLTCDLWKRFVLLHFLPSTLTIFPQNVLSF